MGAGRADGNSLDGLGPLDRPSPLRQRVQDTLRELIIDGAVPPGEHLVESELADRLNVSRGPVREALQALHSQGWVELRPSRGAFVRRPSAREMDEVFAVRTALECEAAALAAARVGSEDLARMRETCARGRAAAAAGDEAAVVAENSALHGAIAALAGVDLLRDYIDALDRRVRWFYRPMVRARGLATWDEHDRVLAALETRDPDEAAGVMRWHTEQTRTVAWALSAPDAAGDAPDAAGDVPGAAGAALDAPRDVPAAGDVPGDSPRLPAP